MQNVPPRRPSHIQTHTVTYRFPSFSPSAYASAFITIVGEERTVAVARWGGAFVVAELLEGVNEE
jgi:pumilio family protein 6